MKKFKKHAYIKYGFMQDSNSVSISYVKKIKHNIISSYTFRKKKNLNFQQDMKSYSRQYAKEGYILNVLAWQEANK